MNKKIFVLLALFFAVISLSCVSAFGSLDNGTDVTVNGANFHIPEGFKSYKLVGSNPETDADFSLYSDDGKEALAFIHIMVSDNISSDSYLSQKLSTNDKVIINGKECYIEPSSDIVSCSYYYSNDKAVQLNVPHSYMYHNKEYYYNDTLAEIIK